MNVQVTLRSGEDRDVITTSHPPQVGSTVMRNGRAWLVTCSEYLLSHRVTSFDTIISR